jgi:hypothetical protein
MRFAAPLLLLALLASACSGSVHTRATPARPPSDLAARLDPYKASLAYARCMRAHGVPHPDPDKRGDFQLTPHQEELMRRAGPAKHEAAEKACFHYLKPVVSTKPLSGHAKARARKALGEHAQCLVARGYDFFSKPVVKNLSRGRAFFGFERTAPGFDKAHRTQRYLRAQRACERVLNRKLNRIIAADRPPPPAP